MEMFLNQPQLKNNLKIYRVGRWEQICVNTKKPLAKIYYSDVQMDSFPTDLEFLSRTFYKSSYPQG